MTSCTNLEDRYRSDRLKENLWMADVEQFADGFASELFVPSETSDSLVENVSAESYYVSSSNRKVSDFVRYKNPYKQVSIASLTKLMTALVVLENCKDLEEYYYVSSDAVALERTASKADLKAGDRVKVIDLLYGLLLPSGNDAAIALAENLDKNYDNFIILMNNEAEKVRALRSHFYNPHGLDSQYHYSTCYDLYLIIRKLMKYPLFYKISNTREWTAEILQGDGTYRSVTWKNTNYFVMGERGISTNVEVLGGKTGFTSNAGNCLAIVSKSNKTGTEYISIVLNATSKDNTYRNTNALLSQIKE